MAVTQLLREYLNCLNTDIHTCTSVSSHFITDSEARLLNNINQYHSDSAFGDETFFGGKDYIVRLEDIHEYYTFLEVCYTLQNNTNTGREEKFGFISLNSEFVVPYCIIDKQKYLPLFYFEGPKENLIHRAVKLENWNLAYLKFCCKLQGIKNKYLTSNYCTVISLDDIKNCCSEETIFEEYWPSRITDLQLLTKKNSTHVNLPGVWIKEPLEVVIAGNSTIPHTLTESVPVLPQTMSVMMNTHQNGCPGNQMVCVVYFVYYKIAFIFLVLKRNVANVFIMYWKLSFIL